MAIVLFCALVIAAGVDIYSAWRLDREMKKFFQSNQEKLF